MTLPKGWKKDASSVEYDKKTAHQDEPPSDDGYIADVTIWKDEVTDGLFRRRVIDARYITTTKIVRNGKWISHGLVEDIIVTNVSAKRKSQSVERDFSGNYDDLRFSESQSEKVEMGDVVFMYQGMPYITFERVQDPQGVANIARSARSAFLQKKAATTESHIYCTQCNAKVPSGSNFCSKCGANLAPGGCPKCGKVNLTGSAFCAQCGSPLG